MTVSIVITSYNYAKYVKDAVNSVLNQTSKDLELIIIDDCSNDNSAEIIMEFANSDNRIKFIRNYENLGLAKSIQTALLAATGEWIVFLESDDVLKENYLEKKFEIAAKFPEAGLIYNNVEFFGDNTPSQYAKYKQIINKNNIRKYPKNMFYNFGYENPILTMSSVMIKRDLIENLNFNTPIDKLLDWYLYVQLAKKTKFCYLNEPLTKWRQHAGSYISQREKIKWKFANISAYLLVLKKEPWNVKLAGFILISTFLMCIKRLNVYCR